MKEITEERCAKIHTFLSDQRGNVRISNITFVNTLINFAESGCNPRALQVSFGK